MKKLEEIVSNSEKVREWGEEERNRRVRQFNKIVEECGDLDSRELAMDALIGMRYVSNTASYWVDMRTLPAKTVARKLKDYLDYLRKSQGFREELVQALVQGLDERKASVVRAMSVDTLLTMDGFSKEDVEASVEAIMKSREPAGERFFA